MALDRAPRLVARQNAARRRAVVAPVGAGAACDAAVRDLAETAEWEMEAFIESKQAEAFVESARALALERVAALSATRRLKTRRRKSPGRRSERSATAPRGDPVARRAGRRAGMAREARGIWNEASAGGARRELEAAQWGDAKASRRRGRFTARAVGGVGSRRRSASRAPADRGGGTR